MKLDRAEWVWMIAAVATATSGPGCNGSRKQECEQFLQALKPLDETPPSARAVDDVGRAIVAVQFQDQPLREYASSTNATLTVLGNALHLQESADPPDGTDDLVKAKLKEARGEKADVAHYCSE